MQKIQPDWHYPRPQLAQKYLDLFSLGLVSARCLFARRRMGKTEFLKNDFIPAAKKEGYIPVYVNLWKSQADAASEIISEFYKVILPKQFKKIKMKLTGKIPGFLEGSIETESRSKAMTSQMTLSDIMEAAHKRKLRLMLIIDEAQVLSYAENSNFTHALRAELDTRKEGIKVIFAGSSESTLRRMFGIPSEPFYNWAPLEPFELLGKEFVAATIKRVNSICKYPLSLDDALDAFLLLRSTPEFFRRYIEHYLNSPEMGSDIILQETKKAILNDDNLKKQWHSLLPADQVILSMVANENKDLYGKQTMQKLGETLGITDGVSSNTIQNALRRLSEKNIISRIDHGMYQFEDEAFADWVKHKE